MRNARAFLGAPTATPPQRGRRRWCSRDPAYPLCSATSSTALSPRVLAFAHPRLAIVKCPTARSAGNQP